MKLAVCLILIVLIMMFLTMPLIGDVRSEDDFITFDSPRWELRNAEIDHHLGRKCLKGTAILKDVEFFDGIIEVDIAVDGHRAYPGVIFRMQSPENYESFYIRPHRAGLYPDALQYTPVISGAAGWQLYHGQGCTAGAVIPAGRWNHLKIVIQGTQARVFWNDESKPALEISELKHGEKKGRIGVARGPGNADVYFSNFKYSLGENLDFNASPEKQIPQGMITNWEISKILPAGDLDIKSLPDPQSLDIFHRDWQRVECEASGLVNIDKHVQRKEPKPYVVFARSTFESEKNKEVLLSFGYSDEVVVFFNRKRLFYGMSAYRSRDRSFVGVVGLNDALYLNTEKGENELIFVLKEYYGGWGFLAKTNPPVTSSAKTD